MLPAHHRGSIARLCGAAFFLLLIADVASAVTISFQQGVDGYAGGSQTSHDYDGTNGTNEIRAELPDLADPAGRYGWIMFADLFDPSAIPMGATISSATLTGFVTNAFGAGSVDLAQLLQDVANRPMGPASLADAGVAGTFYDAAAVTGNHAACGGLDQFLCLPPEEISFDVTSILQNWSGGAANFGFLLVPTRTNSGEMATHGDADLGLRPMLTVTFVPEPASVLLLGIGALALVSARRRA